MSLTLLAAGGLDGENAWLYTGTGAAAVSTANQTSTKIPVNPNERVCLSGYIDATYVVGIAQRGTAQIASQGAATSIAITKPTGVVAGDVLYAFMMIQNPTVGTITTPSGWTSLASTTLAVGTNQALLQVFRRVSDGTDGASYTFSFSASQALSNGSVIAYSGVNNSTPEDAAVVFSTGQADADGNTAVVGVTTVSAGARLLVAAFDPNSAVTPFVPQGFTQQWIDSDGTNEQTTVGFDAMMQQPNSMAPLQVGDYNPSDYFLSAALALKPANPLPRWALMDTGKTTVYAAAYQAPGVAGIIYDYVDVPATVTAMVVVADVNGATVQSGEALLFSSANLEPGDSPSDYIPNVNDELGTNDNPGFQAVIFPGAIINTDGSIQVENAVPGSGIAESQFITSQSTYAGSFTFDVNWLSEGILYVGIFASTNTGYIWEFNNLSGAHEVRIWRLDAGTLTEITNNNLSGTQLTGMPGNLGSNLPVAWQHCTIEYEATGAMRVHVGAKLMATADDNTYVVNGPLGYGYSGSAQCEIGDPRISTAADDTPMPDPLDLAFNVTSKNDIKLTWAFPTAAIPPPQPPRGFAGFEIRYNSTNSFSGSTFVGQTHRRDFLITDPANGSNYYFVAAMNKAGYYDNSPPSVLVAYTQQPFTLKTILGADVGPFTASQVIIGPVSFTVPPGGGRVHVDWTMLLTNGATSQIVLGYVEDTVALITCALHRTKAPTSGTHGFNGSGHFDRYYSGGTVLGVSLICQPASGANCTVNAVDGTLATVKTFLDIQFHPTPN